MTSNFKAPPTADVAEQAIISTVFNDPDTWYPRLRAAGVDENAFWTHRPIYSEIVTFYELTGSTDLPAFVQYLISNGKYDGLGGGSVLETIQYAAYSTAGWSIWVDQLQEAHAKRIAFELHQRESNYETSQEAADAIAAVLGQLKAAKAGPSRSVSCRVAADAFLNEFMANRAAGEIPGNPTGITELDNLSGGMRKNELWVVCGQTSRGKSVLMYQMAAELIGNGKKVAIFSLEMGREEIIGRLVSFMAKMDYGQITQPRLMVSKSDLEKMKSRVQMIKESNFTINDEAAQTIDEIYDECLQIHDGEGPVELVVIDYLQLIEVDKRKGESREQEVARISRKLKQLAKKLRCPVLTGSQLSDEGKVRESRAISHDASALLFIAEDGVKVAKMRNGKKDVVLQLFMHGNMQRFMHYPPSTQSLPK